LADLLAQELVGLPSPVTRGVVWTTDAPYRETPTQLRSWVEKGVLAVEMQAASLFAFARARGAQVGMVALVSNDVDRGTAEFDTGGHEFRARVLTAVARAARKFFSPAQPETSRVR
jgi:uridine phosphorylase